MLLQDATPRQLQQAAALNHATLFRQEAATLGGSVLKRDGLEWTSGSTNCTSMVAFPEMDPEKAGLLLDEMMTFYRGHPPKGAGCWSLDPPQPPDLGVRLLARGFQPGWRPRWMAVDLGQLHTHHPFPRGLIISQDNTSSLDNIQQLPYAQVIIPAPRMTELPGQWTRFVAKYNGRVVAHSVVFLTTGPFGAAGIYHVGVVPRVRHMGIGKAVTVAACLYAREKGYRYAVLNSTDAGRRTYEQLGFATVGEGWTWWLITDRLLSRPPSRGQVELAEAVGRGDLQTLHRLVVAAGDFDLTNGMTMMELATHCHQPAAAEWLVSVGAKYTVLDAWDLGWKDRARQRLEEDPKIVNHAYGEWDKTLLHFAAERNDQELTSLALSAAPDLQLRDKAYKATSLDWAKHFGHSAIVGMIEAYGH
ncbi:MAG TPA: GNAT family N-acetyltransferase [Puia sp.]|nr:GNAT family N-acetyltransferase [Puia sp.]